jgi:hypothetical protein
LEGSHLFAEFLDLVNNLKWIYNLPKDADKLHVFNVDTSVVYAEDECSKQRKHNYAKALALVKSKHIIQDIIHGS